jgi:hypothetical protein
VLPHSSAPKRHHFVPEVHLRAWCDTNGQVAVRRRGEDATFIAHPSNVGVEAGLYGSGLEALWREKNFGLLEDQWSRLRAELINRGHLHGRDRDLASTFMALQIARTREHIAQATFVSELAEFTEERPPTQPSVRRFIQERHGHDPEEPEVAAAWTLAVSQLQQGSPPSFDEAFSISMDIAIRRLAPLIDGLHWRVETTVSPILWTSDRPVMPWPPPSPRDVFEGVGYGDCDEIRMPLTPVAMLVLDRRASRSPSRVDPSRFHDYNRDIALQCYEFLACSPGRRARLNRHGLASNRPAVRFHIAPGTYVDRDGTHSSMGDVVHTWIPLRASEPGHQAMAQ